MNELKRLVKTTGVYFLGTVGTKLISFLLLPLYTAFLLPSQYGQYDVNITYATLISSVCFLDIWTGIMKYMFENEMKLEFISKAKNEAFARVTVAAFASQLDPTIEELADIKTAVSEAVTNCIIHGYENKQGIVKIVGHLKENEIILEISDQGKGIENIDIAKEPLYTTRPNLERSGMGFTIMESFMDTMEIESIVGLGTKITMTKKIKPRMETEEEDFQMITKD